MTAATTSDRVIPTAGVVADLLRPLTDDEATGVRLVTRAQITAALRRAAAEVPPHPRRW